MDRYDFLLVIGESAGGGQEQLRSSILHVGPNAFSDEHFWTAETLAHEYVHAWNGKRHLPAGMRVASFQEPPDFRLLWVYEGLTTYLSFVLAVRSGLWSDRDLKWRLAWAAECSRLARDGAAWRSLEDVCAAASLSDGYTRPWDLCRRVQAHYDEAALLWLEIDCLLRQRSAGDVSLDTFCGRFFARPGAGPVVTYGWGDIVRVLGELSAADWDLFLRERVRAAGGMDGLAAVRASGWTLGYVGQPPAIGTCVDLSSSIGATVDQGGTVVDVVPNGPFHRAGIGPGMRLSIVNDERFNLTRLVDAVGATRSKPLVVDVGRELTIAYDQGHRLPQLERIGGAPDLLLAIAAPRATPRPVPAGGR
jgi:predicted metalloprotease with PDZ domain